MEFRSEPFPRREKHSELRNFVPNHSAEDEHARNSFPNHYEEDKKHSEFQSDPLSEKTLLKLVPKASRPKNWMTLKKHFSRNSVSLRSEPQNGLFQNTRNSAKGTLFPRNSENRSESNTRNFLERNFGGSGSLCSCHLETLFILNQ